ncbi:MAG TPA: DUF4139 domain-containing protein [Verrucomicrobiae bacterium]|nr:DUF4139 domain-containing protein [Verrucomicrobiae bacterium]
MKLRRLAMALFAMIVVVALVSSAPAAGTAATTSTDEGIALTIYNQNFGVVREKRKVDVPEKIGMLRFGDVAAQIDGTSVQFKSLTDPNAKVLEQNYEYDLVSADKLLQKYIDKQIAVLTKDGSRYSGSLLSFDANQLVIRQEDEKSGIVMVQRGDNVKDIQFSALPEGLITKPTLVWKLATDKVGEQLIEVAYQTGGIGWNADYNAVLNANDTALDLGGWVTINNQSGATYKDAKLKLIAGEVHPAQPPIRRMYQANAVTALGAAEAGFEEKPFFEYHLYTLGRPTTVADNQTKQIELLTAADVPVKKVYLYDGAPQIGFYGGLITDANYGSETSNKKVNVIIELKNSQDNHMGMPLPKGKVRLYKRDPADASLEFIGEDQIDHTPKDETIKLHIGDAFDVIGERKRTDFHVDTSRHIMTESFEIRIRNHKEEPVEVTVKETLYRGSNWEVTEASQKWTKDDANTIHFPVKVNKDSEQVITYTVRYTW